MILRDLFRARRAGAENVLGAICGYLIAGSAWAQINAIAYLLVPSAYSISPELASLLRAERLGTDALRTVLVIATWIVVFERRRERATMGAVLLASLAIGWGRHFAVASLDHALSLADHAPIGMDGWRYSRTTPLHK